MVWIQARLLRRRRRSRSGEDWGSMSRTAWRSSRSHDNWWLISTNEMVGVERLRDLKCGNPTGRPLRAPFFEAEKLARPSAAWVIPDRKACIDTSPHHGAASAFVALNALPSENRDQERDGVRSDSARPAARSADRAARFSFTWAMAQLWATRADPQYERSRRSWAGLGRRGKVTPRVM